MPPVHRVVFALTLFQAAGVVSAHDYPTAGRVEFVLECMQRNEGKQEFLYKCACLIDEIAQKYSYDDFIEAATAARYQSLAGDRGGLFRAPPKPRATAKRAQQVQGEAMKRCTVPR